MLKAPFPYFGGKSQAAHIVWQALGQPKHYIEPFFGSGAVLLARPGYNPAAHAETICDKDGQIANVWRSIQFSPDETAKWCDWPVNHVDLAARRRKLIQNEANLLENLVADDTWHDPKMAGYWIWAASCWIGSGMARGQAQGIGKRPHLSSTGNGVHAQEALPPLRWFAALSDRLRRVRVVCGDWSRVCGGNWQDNLGDVGIFFDPPYGHKAGRAIGLYAEDNLDVAEQVNRWCLERGNIKTYRIVLAGYYEEHKNLLAHGWTGVRWKAGGVYGKQGRQQNNNRFREALFMSPHCVGQKEFLCF